MRIGISTSVIQRGKTGISRHLFSLLRQFLHAESSHEFVLFVLEEDLPLFEFARERMEFIPVSERFRPPVRNILWHQTALPALVRRHKLDVLHVPSYRRLLWSQPCALVGTIHDLAPFTVTSKYDSMRMIYGRFVARRLAGRQHAVIAVSQNTAKDIVRFFHLPPGRIRIVPNGIDQDMFFPADRDRAKAAVANRYGIRDEYFLYVARLEHPGKNHVRLIAAFERFKSETGLAGSLVLAGSDWHGAEVIRAAAQASRFSDAVRFLGFVPDSDLPDLYRAAEALVYPSLYEGFGLPPLEAMACGCPVISSTRGSLGEIVTNAAAIVDPEDPNDLFEKLAALRTDPGLRSRLGEAGLKRAAAFTWEGAAAGTLEAYNEALRTARPSPAARALAP